MGRVVTYPKWVLWICLSFLGMVIGLNLIFPPPLDKVKVVSSVVVDRHDQWMTGFTVEDGIWRIKANLDGIDPRFIDRLIEIEDRRFWEHSGVDVPAIFRAANSWHQAGKPVSGASTITMQLVRQIEPRKRTLTSKMIESLRALQYELFLSKQDILEAYLTHISYGGNIDGIEAATLSYFGKTPDELSDAEIALLIAIPQAPESRRPDLWPNVAKRGRDKISGKLLEGGVISNTQYEEAYEIPVTVKKNPIPETAWLTAKRLKTEHHSVRATIDMDLQKDVEAIAREYLEQKPNTVNLAMTVVDNETMAVRAHIASGGRDRAGGWLDMTQRYRSPGSTLKPFIYGLAMDDGLLSSSTWIEDAPTRFGSYQPENFNRRYYGSVRIHEALRHSLNVPAVAVLDRIGGQRFEESLQNAGLDLVRLGRKSEKAGLALALGGTGVTLNDLAVGYAALANAGLARPLRWLESAPIEPGQYLVEPETAGKITDILRQSPTPDGRVPGWLSAGAPPIAYKTGTSYGFRDAWAAGYTDKWTIVVWVGRPDGAPRDGETGRKAAAPLLFDVLTALPHIELAEDYHDDIDAPLGQARVKDYTESGPQILFPPDGVELIANAFGPSSRGFTFSARTHDDSLKFFVNEKPVPAKDEKYIWRPDTSGFYKVVAVDGNGREAISNISVLALGQLPDPRF